MAHDAMTRWYVERERQREADAAADAKAKAEREALAAAAPSKRAEVAAARLQKLEADAAAVRAELATAQAEVEGERIEAARAAGAYRPPELPADFSSRPVHEQHALLRPAPDRPRFNYTTATPAERAAYDEASARASYAANRAAESDAFTAKVRDERARDEQAAVAGQLPAVRSMWILSQRDRRLAAEAAKVVQVPAEEPKK